MGAPLDDPSPVDDEEEVGLAHRGEAVGDDEGGPTGQRRSQGLLHRRLGLGVEVGGGLVEYDDVGGLQEQAGQGHPLLLPAREAVATLAHDGVEPVGQGVDQVKDLGLLEGPVELVLGGVGPGVEEVGPEACRGRGGGPG